MRPLIQVMSVFRRRLMLIGRIALIVLWVRPLHSYGQTISFDFDPFNSNNLTIEEVFDTIPLDSAQTYCLEVKGTYSAWPASFWTNPCGLIRNQPIFNSPSNPTGGNVGFDFIYIFSLPNNSRCAGGVLPRIANPNPRVEITLDSGATWFHPGVNLPLDSNHIYNYIIEAKGFPIGVRQNTTLNNDDYGILRFKMVKKPEVNFGVDTTLCIGNTLLLDATNPNSTYLWQDSSTNSTFTVTEAGVYWVEVLSDSICTNSDTIRVNFDSLNIDLGKDTSLCQGDSIVLDIGTSGATYLWQDNSTSPTLTVNTPGLYWVEASKGSTESTFTVDRHSTYWVEVRKGACLKTDSIKVSFDTLEINLGSDTILCEGDSILLDATTTGVTYLWQDNSTSPTFTVNNPGLYWVEAKKGNCTQSDTILIDDGSISLELGRDTGLCSGEVLLLDATNSNSTYLWQDGSTEPTLMVEESGSIWVEVSNLCEQKRDSIEVNFVDCDCTVSAPNIFSPNGDGINDELEVFTACDLTSFHFEVYNRWGEVVFESNNISIKWNGRFEEQAAAAGTYFYILKTTDSFGVEKESIGSITLVR